MAGEAREAPFREVAILGLGVMGGSLARALAGVARPPVRVGWSPDPGEGSAALACGALTRVAAGVGEAIAGADLVVLAMPLDACLELLPEVVREMSPSGLLTDVASLKLPVQRALGALGAGAPWVGSHPMCGDHRSGFAAARDDLYLGARVWIVAPPGTEEGAARLSTLWSQVGATAAPISAEEHDTLMAWASHLPQLTATALASVLADAGILPGDMGPGGRDTTRLSGSSPEMWAGILEHAPRHLGGALRSLAERVREIGALVESGDTGALRDLMQRTRSWKESP